MFYLSIFILGAIIGSFLNVVILRLHSGEKIVRSRSHCPHCRQPLHFRDLLPLVSFVWQLGRCHYCRQKLSWQYPAVELATGLFFVLATYNLIGNLGGEYLFYDSQVWLRWLRDLVFICFLIVIFVYDLRWYLILDRVTLPAMAVAVIFNLWLGLAWQSLALGLLIGLGFFALQFVVSRGRWIGGGDLRLGALLGLMLGGQGVIVALFIAYIVGAVVAVGLVLVGKKGFKSQIPFGTFLALGALLTLFWGEEILRWYLSLI